jgi:integrase
LIRKVADAATPPSEKAAKAPEQTWWSPQQLREILDITAESCLRPAVALAGLTALRRGEVCGLSRSDVDLDAGVLDVRGQLNIVRGQPNGGFVF